MSSIFNNKTCPGGAVHCHTGAGSVSFPEYNTKIEATFNNLYSKGWVSGFLNWKGCKAGDIVLLNFGLHYNDHNQYNNMMKILAHDINTYLNSTQHGYLLYMQTFPQHFRIGSKKAGYYTPHEDQGEGSEISGKRCAPYHDINIAHRHDWRNRIADTYLKNTTIPIIRVSEGLYSQFDAHVDGDSTLTPFNRADCTHYCLHSAAFDYVHMMTYNHLLLHVPLLPAEPEK